MVDHLGVKVDVVVNKQYSTNLWTGAKKEKKIKILFCSKRRVLSGFKLINKNSIMYVHIFCNK